MKNTINLMEHNKLLYNKIVAQIENGETRIFYSEATGLGKSFIFMKLMQDYFEGKRVLYIVPKISIWENLIHYEEFSYIDAEVEMRTFASFNRYSTDYELYDRYDAVFVDECHHMLSDIQGKNVAEFLDDMYCADKYAFGFTATPCVEGTYVDDVYFDVSCYGYDVFEAIKNGILPKVDIAVADVDVDNIPDNLKAEFSIAGTKPLLRQILDERQDITHWIAYFSRVSDLLKSEREIEALFPEFKIMKLYRESKQVANVIKEFEEYRGRVILLSVSMVLEGVHLNNVGGVLLYRNVGRDTTYFQIYGRLCKMGVKKSPLFLDVTNSIFNLRDFNGFKSKRYRVAGVTYTAKDLFDVTSHSYRYVELKEAMNKFSVKEYRGVKWTTLSSLSVALHKGLPTISLYLKRHKDKSAKDYIDFVLGDSDYTKYLEESKNRHVTANVRKSYRGIEWSSKNELRNKLGCSNVKVNNWINKGFTEEDLIDSVLQDCDYDTFVNNGYKVIHKYRGITWSTVSELCDKMGVNTSNLYSYLRRNKDKTVNDYIDRRLGIAQV